MGSILAGLTHGLGPPLQQLDEASLRPRLLPLCPQLCCRHRSRPGAQGRGVVAVGRQAELLDEFRPHLRGAIQNIGCKGLRVYHTKCFDAASVGLVVLEQAVAHGRPSRDAVVQMGREELSAECLQVHDGFELGARNDLEQDVGHPAPCLELVHIAVQPTEAHGVAPQNIGEAAKEDAVKSLLPLEGLLLSGVRWLLEALSDHRHPLRLERRLGQWERHLRGKPVFLQSLLQSEGDHSIGPLGRGLCTFGLVRGLCHRIRRCLRSLLDDTRHLFWVHDRILQYASLAKAWPYPIRQQRLPTPLQRL
mmetsp:Transcript_52420/g.170160  ORF Transcript_52420/g.170160 Transcript_52420/m.170160 type:complete len:306 (+) Transcript_52420:609-1526(+)